MLYSHIPQCHEISVIAARECFQKRFRCWCHISNQESWLQPRGIVLSMKQSWVIHAQLPYELPFGTSHSTATPPSSIDNDEIIDCIECSRKLKLYHSATNKIFWPIHPSHYRPRTPAWSSRRNNTKWIDSGDTNDAILQPKDSLKITPTKSSMEMRMYAKLTIRRSSNSLHGTMIESRYYTSCCAGHIGK